MADGGKECMVDLFMKSLDRWLFIYASSSLKTGKNLTKRPITPLMELFDSEKQPGWLWYYQINLNLPNPLR